MSYKSNWDSFENRVWVCGGLSHMGAKNRRPIWWSGGRAVGWWFYF